MKLRIIQEGFQNYTAQLGVHNFVDGLSVEDVSQMDATRMGAVMQFEWEDGTSPSVTQRMLDTSGDSMPVEPTVTAPPAIAPVTTELKPAVTTAVWTEDALAAIADAKGIAGIREITDPMGLKNNSIRGLIDAVLKQATTVKA